MNAAAMFNTSTKAEAEKKDLLHFSFLLIKEETDKACLIKMPRHVSITPQRPPCLHHSAGSFKSTSFLRLTNQLIIWATHQLSAYKNGLLHIHTLLAELQWADLCDM